MIPPFSPRHFACFATLFTLVTANAEMPPQAYVEMQKNSAEALTIEAVTVKTEGSSVTVEAKVVSVERSGSGLKPGDQIRIHYQIFHLTSTEIVTGPSDPMLLEAGKRYRSYLLVSESSGIYNLAARGKSFIGVPPIDPPQ